MLPISCRNCCHSGAYACLRPCCQKCEAGLVRIFHRELEPAHERGQYFRRRHQGQDFNRRRIDREIKGAHHDNDRRKKRKERRPSTNLRTSSPTRSSRSFSMRPIRRPPRKRLLRRHWLSLTTRKKPSRRWLNSSGSRPICSRHARIWRARSSRSPIPRHSPNCRASIVRSTMRYSISSRR